MALEALDGSPVAARWERQAQGMRLTGTDRSGRFVFDGLLGSAHTDALLQIATASGEWRILPKNEPTRRGYHTVLDRDGQPVAQLYPRRRPRRSVLALPTGETILIKNRLVKLGCRIGNLAVITSVRRRGLSFVVKPRKALLARPDQEMVLVVGAYGAHLRIAQQVKDRDADIGSP